MLIYRYYYELTPHFQQKKTGTGPVTLDVEFECWLRVDSNHVHLHGDIKCAVAPQLIQTKGLESLALGVITL